MSSINFTVDDEKMAKLDEMGAPRNEAPKKLDLNTKNLLTLGGFIARVLIEKEYDKNTADMYARITASYPDVKNPVETALMLKEIVESSEQIMEEWTDGNELCDGKYVYCYTPKFFEWYKDKICEWECDPKKKKEAQCCMMPAAPFMSNFEKMLHYNTGECLLPENDMINYVMKIMQLKDSERSFVQTAYFLITRKMHVSGAACYEEQQSDELDEFINEY